MSGLGRRTHYRKHLTDSVLYDYPEPASNECIAKIIATRGSNQFDIQIAKPFNEPTKDSDDNNETKSGTELAILPTKFRKLIWLKRNDFVIVQYATDDHTSDNRSEELNKQIEPSVILNEDRIDDHDSSVCDDLSKATTTPNDASMGGGGIRYMITHILYKNQIQHLITAGLWPTHDTNFHDTTTADSDFTTSTTTDSDGIVFTINKNNMKNVRDDNVLNNEGNVENETDDDDENDGSYNSDIDYATEDDNDDDLFINTNRMAKIELQDDSDDEE